MRILALALTLPLLAQDRPLPVRPPYVGAGAAVDVHSVARLGGPKVRHLVLDLKVDFKDHRLSGHADWTLDREGRAGEALHLDARELDIASAETSADGKAWRGAAFRLEAGPTPELGKDLQIDLAPGVRFVRIQYRTSPEASGLQWLEPAQTSGGRQPFLFSQAQALHARSFYPCQDGPGVRFTFEARLRTPKHLRALMASDFDRQAPRNGDYRFRMAQPIPSYLLALAVGDLRFQDLGPRTGVWAEPGVLKKAAKELEDTEAMLKAAESLFGPYRWGRYDLLMLPPSFPFGGMENPRLTFATPTILAGDKSLVSLVAHELAHSWSGNLVTNATWRDFWLNEGFTTYVERRIVEAVYGKAQADMEAALGLQSLGRTLKGALPGFQKLYPDLGTQDPDAAFSDIPYEKGCLLLRTLEQAAGRAAFDRWLRAWFDDHAFRTATTAEFLEHLRKALPNLPDLDPWLLEPGLPAAFAKPPKEAFAAVDAQVAAWTRDPAKLDPRGWSTHQWLHFLRAIPAPTLERMVALDRAHGLTKTGNAEIAHAWLLLAIRQGYAPAMPRLDAYLRQIGRRKLIVPLYQELARTPQGKARAKAIYAKARPGYHPIARTTVDGVLGWGK